MKSLIIYSSQTGFTERYAQWLAERIQAETIRLQEAEKKDLSFFAPFDALIYGGWALAGSIHKSPWFIKRMEEWSDKKLALFCVGASPIENPEVAVAMSRVLDDNQAKLAQVFYCPGGLNYDAMPFFSKLGMKAFAATLRRKKDQTSEQKEVAEMIANSYDISDPKYLEPLVTYLTEGERHAQ